MQDDDQLLGEHPPIPNSMKEVLEAYGVATIEEPAEATTQIMGYIHELKEIKREMDCLKAREGWLKDRIGTHMLNRDVLVDPETGVFVATWKAVTSERFDQRWFERENSELAKKYRVERQTRVFLLKGKKDE